MERNFLNLISDIYKKPTANILSGKKLDAFLVRSRTVVKGCALPPLLFKIILELLANAINKKKGIHIGRKK